MVLPTQLAKFKDLYDRDDPGDNLRLLPSWFCTLFHFLCIQGLCIAGFYSVLFLFSLHEFECCTQFSLYSYPVHSNFRAAELQGPESCLSLCTF